MCSFQPISWKLCRYFECINLRLLRSFRIINFIKLTKESLSFIFLALQQSTKFSLHRKSLSSSEFRNVHAHLCVNVSFFIYLMLHRYMYVCIKIHLDSQDGRQYVQSLQKPNCIFILGSFRYRYCFTASKFSIFFCSRYCIIPDKLLWHSVKSKIYIILCPTKFLLWIW